MRLNKYLAAELKISRRNADELIKYNAITINDEPIELGKRIEDGDTIVVNLNIAKNVIHLKHNIKTDLTVKLNNDREKKTISIYKPPKCICSKRSFGDDRTIYDLLPEHLKHLNYAGRLDQDSEGLLIMSEDGELINQLTHPKFGSKKSYIVVTREELTEQDIDIINKGVKIDQYTTRPVNIDILDKSGKDLLNDEYPYLRLASNDNISIWTLSEGRNRQIRKSIKLLDKKVTRLIRTQHGDYELTAEIYKQRFR